MTQYIAQLNPCSRAAGITFIVLEPGMTARDEKYAAEHAQKHQLQGLIFVL
jgi:hypothetical protein